MAPLSRTPTRKRGFTLLEILVVSAIAAILVVTAASLLVTMSSQRAANRKRLDRLTQSFTAMTLLERSLLNGGYHFPSARFGFRVYDNVSSGTRYGGFPVAPSCGSGLCVTAQTDVLELVEGLPETAGRLVSIKPDGGPTLSNPGGPIFYDAGTEQFLLMIGTSDGGNCLGIGFVDNNFGIQYRPVDRDLNTQSMSYYTVATAPANYQCPPVPSAPNATDFTVSVAADRHLYMVLAFGDGGSRALYQVDIPALSIATTGDAGAMTVLARGIDNFQVMPLVTQGGTGFSAGCANGICECNSGGDCTLAGANSTAEFQNTSRVIGVKIGLSSRGETDDRIPLPAVVPPRLGNETMPADLVKRTSQTQTYMLRNFAQVQP